MRIPLVDQHCYRFLWREMQDKSPDTYVITKVNMGDRLSGSVLSLALDKIDELKSNNLFEESRVILNSSYMNDINDWTVTISP